VARAQARELLGGQDPSRSFPRSYVRAVVSSRHPDPALRRGNEQQPSIDRLRKVGVSDPSGLSEAPHVCCGRLRSLVTPALALAVATLRVREMAPALFGWAGAIQVKLPGFPSSLQPPNVLRA
jgi:hypothetical protein